MVVRMPRDLSHLSHDQAQWIVKGHHHTHTWETSRAGPGRGRATEKETAYADRADLRRRRPWEPDVSSSWTRGARRGEG